VRSDGSNARVDGHVRGVHCIEKIQELVAHFLKLHLSLRNMTYEK
jgi:hypothetical protein